MPAYTRSPEQEAFRAQLISNPSQSVLLEAVAGSGKTATLIDSLDVLTNGATCLMAFNKKIAAELEERVRKQSVQVQMNTTVGTVHALGLRSWKKGGKSSRVQGGKLSFIFDDYLDDKRVRQDAAIRNNKALVRRLCSFAKSAGFGLSSKDEHFPSITDEDAWESLIDHFNMISDIDAAGLSVDECINWGVQLLQESNSNHAMIDFDDMIYLPLLEKMQLPTYTNVLIDEAQDTNVTRREMAFRMLRPGGRMIAVGDPHQAIYGFTGADAAALANIQRRADAVRMPLSVCWRCDEKIIEHAQRWVSHIRSYDTSGAGSVSQIEFDEDFMDRLQDGDAVLCRLNKPNVSLAIGLLRRGRSARIEGRDLGEKLLAHAKKAAPEKPKLDELQLALEPYLAHQVNLLVSRDKEAEAALLEDEVDALHMLIERCLEQGKKSYSDLEALAQLLFQDDAHKQRCILLSSVHKSKGLEWPRVYLLGREDYMPFFKAELDWELEQEVNLIYVAVTRAKHELIEVTGVRAALDQGLHRAAPRAKVKA